MEGKQAKVIENGINAALGNIHYMTREPPKAVYELENYGAETERCVYCLFQRRIVD
jgi:hypothetical protein